MIPRDTPHPFLHPADAYARAARTEAKLRSVGPLSPKDRLYIVTSASAQRAVSAGQGRTKLSACITALPISLHNMSPPYRGTSSPWRPWSFPPSMASMPEHEGPRRSNVRLGVHYLRLVRGGLTCLSPSKLWPQFRADAATRLLFVYSVVSSFSYTVACTACFRCNFAHHHSCIFF